MDGISVAFTSYGIAAAISMLTAALMAVIVKIIEANNRRNQKKK